jgi:DNA-dependent RNA polymerase auxiliary subunit epsilon
MSYEASTGSYKVVKINRSSLSFNATDVISKGKFPFAAGFQPNSNFHRFMSLMENELMDYDADTGDFEILKCNFDNFTIGDALPCSRMVTSQFPTSSTSMSCENHTNISTCGAAPACGWCQERSICYRGGPLGPCFAGASCQAWYFTEPHAGEQKGSTMGYPLALKPSPKPNPSPSPKPIRRKTNSILNELPVVEIPEDLMFIPKFDSHEMTYLGRDAMLDYEPATGHYRIWQFDRVLSEKGEPFLSPPLVRGLWSAPNRRLVFLGFDRLLDYAPGSGKYAFWQCDHTYWSSGRPLQCSNVGEGKDATLKGDKQFIYIGMDAILSMHTPTGRYQIFKYARKEGKRNMFPSSDVLASGTWAQMRGMQLTYMGSDMLLSYDELTGSYKYWMLKRSIGNSTSDPLEGPIAEGAFSDIRHRFVPMQEDRLLDLDPTSGRYRVLQCDRTPCEASGSDKDMAMIKPLVCDTFGSGAFRSDEVLVEDYETIPAAHEVVYMEGTHDEHHLFDYDPITGKYRIFAFKSLRANLGCAPLPFAPLVEGTWPFTDHKFLSLGKDTLLDYDTEFGAFRVWHCDRSLYTPGGSVAGGFDGVRGPSAMPCQPTALGMWKALVDRNSSFIIYLDGDKLLDVDPMTGSYNVWSFQRDPNNVPSLPGKVVASGVSELLIGKELTYVKDSMVLLVDTSTTAYELMVYDRDATGKEKLLQGPIAEGSWKKKDQSVLFLGEDRFMVFDVFGDYEIHSCDRKQYSPGVPLACEPLGSANLQRQMGCNHTSCSACSSDPACGWCTLTQKCISGGSSGPCEESECLANNFEYGYCADEPCAFFHTCEDCLGTKLCGWCDATKECVPGTDAAPLTGTCDLYKYRFCSEPISTNATVVHYKGI